MTIRENYVLDHLPWTLTAINTTRKRWTTTVSLLLISKIESTPYVLEHSYT